MITIGKTNFYNLPKVFVKEDYEKGIDLVIKNLTTSSSVHSAYLMGRQWVPGISDVDIIVVFKDGPLHDLPAKPSQLAGDKMRHLFTHDYIKYSVEGFSKIKYTYPTYYDLECIVGQPIDTENPIDFLSDEQYNNLKLSFVIDILINKVLLVPLIFKGKIDVRHALLWLNSVRYTSWLAKEITRSDFNDGNFFEDITVLRMTWFEKNIEENLYKLENLINYFPNLIEKMVLSLDNYLKQFVINNTNSVSKFNSTTFSLIGDRDWNKVNFLKRSSQNTLTLPLVKKRIKRYHLIVPESFFLILGRYAIGDNHYNQWFRSFLDIQSPLLMKSHEGIDARIKYMSEANICKSGRVLTTTYNQFGFHGASLISEKLKAKTFNFWNSFIQHKS